MSQKTPGDQTDILVGMVCLFGIVLALGCTIYLVVTA